MSMYRPGGQPQMWIQKKRYLIPLVLFAVAILALVVTIPLSREQAARDRAAAASPTITTVTKTPEAVTETVTSTKTTTVTPTTSRRSTTRTTTRSGTTGTSSETYYASCAEVREDDAAPLYRYDPGYRSGLDPDDDGVACDS